MANYSRAPYAQSVLLCWLGQLGDEVFGLWLKGSVTQVSLGRSCAVTFGVTCSL